MNVSHPVGVLPLLSIKFFYDKMDLRLFHFRVRKYDFCVTERLYRRDLGQIGILGGNWHFRWG